jgi:hypothetical protein
MGKNYLKVVTLALLLAFVGSIAGSSYNSAEAENEVNISLNASSTVLEGGIFTVRVNVAAVADLTGYDFLFTYDPLVVQVNGVNPGLIGSSAMPLDEWGFIPPASTGMIRVFGHVPYAAQGGSLAGEGHLADIQMQAIGTMGLSSQLTITSMELRGSLAQLIPTNSPVSSQVLITAHPTVTLESLTLNPTNQTPITVSAAFSAEVTGFTIDDVVVDNGAASGFSGGPQVYTIEITPSSQGLVTVDIPEGAAQNGAGLGNIAALQFSRTYDSIAPSAVISSTSGNLTNLSPVPFTAVFSENVTGFAVEDIVVGNGAAGDFAGSLNSYSFGVTPLSQGQITVNIPPGAALDAAGNGNTAAIQFSLTFDNVSPAVTEVDSNIISGIHTVGQVIDFDITFSENVTVNLAGGTPSLALNSGGQAGYKSGSGSNNLTFEYIIEAGQNAPALDYISVNSLALNGGEIVDDALNNASVILPQVGTFLAGHAIVIDTALPTLTALSVTFGLQGNTYDLEIQGIHLSWTSSISFSTDGITVNHFTVSPNGDRIDANITIAENAAGGAKDILVVNPAGTSAPLAGGFTVWLRGDANMDGEVSVGDILTTELIMLGLAEPTLTADANWDGRISIGDVIKIELIILSA